MNYNADKPIETAEQDTLGRATFSDHLGEAIYEYDMQDGLVIGIYGGWGTGKTSIINMAINKIHELAEHNENKAIIVKFNPWNYTDKDNLISMFFHQLRDALFSQVYWKSLYVVLLSLSQELLEGFE